MKKIQKSSHHFRAAIFCSFLLLILGLPQFSLAHFSQSGRTAPITPCTDCHTLETGGTFYVAVDGTETLTVSAVPSQILEVDYYFTGVMGSKDDAVGVQVDLPASTWSPNVGTVNNPTISGPGWDSSWDASNGGSLLSYTGNTGFAVYYAGTGFDSGNGDVAQDDGTEPDGTADLHGTDFRITVPAGTSTGAYLIRLVGVGHTVNPRTSKSVILTVNVTGATNTPPTITSSAPTTATEDVQYNYTPTVSDADGPGTNWSVLPADDCGGTFAAGTYSFTPTGPTPPANCDVAIQVCDGGSPDLCDTEGPVTVTITAVNDPPSITSSAPTTAT